MKTRALAINVADKSKKTVTAFDAVYMREFSGEKFKNYKFYYADSKKQLFEMTPKFIKAKNTAFFAFKSDSKPDFAFEDDGESLTHYAAKKALARLKELRLIDVKTKRELRLNVIKGENEKLFEFDKPYYADVYFKLDNNQSKNMKKYFYKWEEQLVVEIFVSHKVSADKAKAFAENNVPIFEVKIPQSTRDKFELESCSELSKAKIEKAINNMQRMFEKGIRGAFISDPATKEYEQMCKYKEEIEKFKAARDNAEKEYIISQQKLDKLNEELKQAESKKEYYEILENYKKHPIKFLFSKIKKG